jgi:hypothetical protein
LKHIAFVTDHAHGSYTPDDGLAVPLLEAADTHVSAAIWNDPAVDWSAFDLIIVRTTWDYSHHFSEFQAWLDQMATIPSKVLNPPAIMRWNVDKNYLRELETRGVVIVPTIWHTRGTTIDLRAEMRQHGWTNVVIKPTISAGSHRTWHITAPVTDLDQTHLAEILTDSDAMIQPFAESILTEGEWSFIFFNRQFSHAILKQAQSGDFRIQPQFGGITIPINDPPAALLQQAVQVLDQVEVPLLYARVDGVNVMGQFQLMELELIEPRLFLDTNEQAAARFAAAIRQVL